MNVNVSSDPEMTSVQVLLLFVECHLERPIYYLKSSSVCSLFHSCIVEWKELLTGGTKNFDHLLYLAHLLQGETWIHKAKYTILGRWWNRREPHKTCTLCTNLITMKQFLFSLCVTVYTPPVCLLCQSSDKIINFHEWSLIMLYHNTTQTKSNGQTLLFPLLTWLVLSGGYTRINKVSRKAASRNVIWHFGTEILAKILLVR